MMNSFAPRLYPVQKGYGTDADVAGHAAGHDRGHGCLWFRFGVVVDLISAPYTVAAAT